MAYLLAVPYNESRDKPFHVFRTLASLRDNDDQKEMTDMRLNFVIIFLTVACSSPSSTEQKVTLSPLIVKTDKRTLRFGPRGVKDGACVSDDCIDFKRKDLASDKYALVQKIYYEGSEWILIEMKSGAEYVFPALPSPSPDFNHFIVINNDETGDGEDSGTFIYQRDLQGHIARVKHFPLTAFAPMKLEGWKSSDCADISGFTAWGQPDFDTTVVRRASIVRRHNNQWELSLRPCY